MTPRNFSWAVIVGFALLFAGTVFANVFIDPEGVFGGAASNKTNLNSRYLEFEHYRLDASQIDGLILASSRGQALDNNLFAKRSGSRQILNFSVPFGLVTDHLPLLKYVLRDKQERGERLKSVLLLLDVDLFGKTPWTNTNIDAFLPPALSGESPIRFWWRYLTAFQYGHWRNSLRMRYRSARSGDGVGTAAASPQPILASLLPTTIVRWPSMLQASVVTASSEVRAVAAEDAMTAAHRGRQSSNSRRPDLTRQLSYLKQIVMLCRDNGVSLAIATSPMVRANLNGYPPGELEALTDELSRLTPIWDFASPPWLADSPGYWTDFSHFSNAVGTMMIDRMFGGDSPPVDFGRFRVQR
jgi:hypothetical protein